MSRHPKQFIALCAATAFLVGGSHTIRLKVVDAATHQPLEGVSAQWVQARHQMFQELKQEGPTNLPPTGLDGVIKVGGLHRWWSSDFIFSLPGYSNVYGVYGTRGLTLSGRMKHFPPGRLQDQFYLEGNLTVADKSNGCFLVEMQK